MAGGGLNKGLPWLCVVVKYLEHDALVITAYLADKPKKGTLAAIA